MRSRKEEGGARLAAPGDGGCLKPSVGRMGFGVCGGRAFPSSAPALVSAPGDDGGGGGRGAARLPAVWDEGLGCDETSSRGRTAARQGKSRGAEGLQAPRVTGSAPPKGSWVLHSSRRGRTSRRNSCPALTPAPSPPQKHRSPLGILRRFPFSSSLQRMSVLVKPPGEASAHVYIKGAPEMVASLCGKETGMYWGTCGGSLSLPS